MTSECDESLKQRGNGERLGESSGAARDGFGSATPPNGAWGEAVRDALSHLLLKCSDTTSHFA